MAKKVGGEGNWVAIQVCPICQKDMGLLLDKRMRDSFPQKNVCIPTDVCDECKEKYLKTGIMLVDRETGSMIVITEEAFRGLFEKEMPKQIFDSAINHRILLVKESLIQDIMNHIPKEDKECPKSP